MPVGLVNQLMACYWIEQGIELEESQDAIEEKSVIIDQKLRAIRRRRKIQFDF